MTARRRSLATGAALLCCGAVATAPALAGSGARHSTEAENHQAAVQDATQLLTRANLPPGATPSVTEPSGDSGVLASPAFTVGVTNLASAHAWWTVNEPALLVSAYERANAPSGAKPDTTCGPMFEAPRWTCVSWSFPAQPGVLGVRRLVVEIVGLGHAITGIRVDTEVQWIVPRPASEKVPHGVHAIQIVEAVPGQAPLFATVVTQASEIHGIVRRIDQLPTLQPATYMCPRLPDGHPFVTLTFRGSKTGPALARASQEAYVGETASDTGCFAMSFAVNGRPQTALIHGTRFLQNLGRTVGFKLTHGR